MTLPEFLKMCRGLHDARISRFVLDAPTATIQVDMTAWMGAEQWQRCKLSFIGVERFKLASAVPLDDLFEAAAAMLEGKQIISFAPKELHSDENYTFDELVCSELFIVFKQFTVEWLK